MELWSGSIVSLDGALQLFLIVDYICDWARDVYRPAILNELRVLSSPDNVDIKTDFTDTDIYSSRGIFRMGTQEAERNNSQNGLAPVDILGCFRALDSSNGIVRHASQIESRFSALFITRDNIETMLLSVPENIVQHFSRQIIAQLQDKSLMLMPEQLGAIEELWTGNNRTSIPFNIGQTSFYTVITVTSYMTVRWEQLRELAVIAVAEDAFDVLLTGSGLKPGWGKAKKPTVRNVDKDLVVSTVAGLRDGSMRHNLLAAITRISLYVECQLFNPEVMRLSTDDGVTWELVNHAYKLFKRGRLEPTEPFLRISTRIDTQTPSDSCKGPFYFEEELEVSSSNAVLVHGGAHSHEGKKVQSSHCVYLVGESLEVPDQDTLATIIKDTFEDFDVYHTTRDNGKLSLKEKKEYKAPWNLARSYGLYFSYGREFSFSAWLRSLNAAVPTRQGSPRGASDSGNMLQREYRPWHDPRLIHGGPFAEKKLKFLRKLITLEYRIWGSIAEERRAQGIRCCICCAALLDDEPTEAILCDDCEFEMDDPRYPKWFGKQLEKSLLRQSRVREPSTNIEPQIEYNIGTPEISPLPPSYFERIEEEGFRRHNINDEVGSDSEVSMTNCLLTTSPVPMATPSEASPASASSMRGSRKRKRPI
jgi:hypothetical protein